MLPIIPQSLNKLIQDPQGRPSTYPFPPNVAGDLPKEMRQRIYRWMLQNYIWPQVMERQVHEARWDKLLQMAHATWKYDNLNVGEKTRQDRNHKQKLLEGILPPDDRCEISDTIIFDAVDRLNNLNHFVSFKNSLPVRYEWPEDMEMPFENSVYAPSDRLIRSANGWLKFNADGADFYRKHWMTNRHHLTYGCCFVSSEFEQEIKPMMRRVQDNKFEEQMELTKIGTTFQPISIRKLWLNYRLTPYEMEYQPCPFFYEVMPRFAIIAKPYDPISNPFGYSNLSSLPKGQYIFSSQETASFESALKLVNPDASISQLTPPELGVELNWVMYPMLPFVDLNDVAYVKRLPQETQEKILTHLQSLQSQGTPANELPRFLFDDGEDLGLPLQRHIMEAFGTGLNTGMVEITRLQKNFYPHDSLPIYGSAHMPSLDEGAYPAAMGDILECHYVQVTKALNQYLENKDLINDPPIKILATSPANTKDINKPGSRNKVFSLKDYEKDTIVDGGQATPAFVNMVRGFAQTSSKAVDALLGKAMGSRTSATEAGNAFETAMSGATTDINLFNKDISGGFATRCWEYGGLWVDPDVLAAITGQYGMMLTPQHLQIRLGLKWDIGSTYIESLTRQQNIRYVLETSANNPQVNSAELLKMLLREWKFTNVDAIVNDGGLDEEIKLSNLQACETYLGELVMVDPDQNHQVAIKVKVSYLKDRTSVWNTDKRFVANGPKLVEQISLHQFYLQLQMMQQQAAMMQTDGDPNAAASLQSLQRQGGGGPEPMQRVGQLAQQMGGAQ